ncbi:Acidic amino acid decarboxylase GADL1 [Aix galericulata]|nr:Acidic amino acid decarboxylase GADL1 [Aix galericulata]
MALRALCLTVGICKQDMLQKKKNAVLVDGVILNGPIMDSKAGEKFVEEACKIIMEEVIQKANDVTEKVCEWQAPETLKKILDLEMRDTGESHQKLLQLCQDVIQYSVKTSHPRFFNQLYAGIDYYSLVARFITEALNPSVYTYEVSPVFLLVEETVIKKMIEFIGWEEGDGIFNPGGSVSNMYAMNLARYKFCPEIKEKGLSGLPRLVLFTSEECHYSMKKAASFLGIGTENVYFVKTDERGKMIPEELEKQVQRARKEGSAPFLVCATAGTTVLGAFDPLDEIADICEKHGLWLHVDASWGGSALISRKHCRLLRGIHRADSVAWNPHKMLLAGIQCCALLVKDSSGLLKKCYSAKAAYLFQQDKFYDVSYDTGDKSIQCSRRPDAFKFWLMWKALGTTGLEERVNRALALARYLVEEIKKREGFQLLLEPEYANVCFWYIPPSLRKMEDGPEFWQKLHEGRQNGSILGEVRAGGPAEAGLQASTTGREAQSEKTFKLFIEINRQESISPTKTIEAVGKESAAAPSVAFRLNKDFLFPKPPAEQDCSDLQRAALPAAVYSVVLQLCEDFGELLRGPKVLSFLIYVKVSLCPSVVENEDVTYWVRSTPLLLGDSPMGGGYGKRYSAVEFSEMIQSTCPCSFSENCHPSIANDRKDFRAVAMQCSVRKWLNPGALGTQGDFSFSGLIAMLMLVEEWKEGLQQCEGRTNKMYNNAVMIEKKYFHPQVKSAIKLLGSLTAEFRSGEGEQKLIPMHTN